MITALLLVSIGLNLLFGALLYIAKEQQSWDEQSIKAKNEAIKVYAEVIRNKDEMIEMLLEMNEEHSKEFIDYLDEEASNGSV